MNSSDIIGPRGVRKEQLDSSDGEDGEDIGISGGANKRGASIRFQKSDMAAKVEKALKERMELESRDGEEKDDSIIVNRKNVMFRKNFDEENVINNNNNDNYLIKNKADSKLEFESLPILPCKIEQAQAGEGGSGVNVVGSDIQCGENKKHEGKSDVAKAVNNDDESPIKPLNHPPAKNYRRMLSAPEIVLRYPIGASADDALKGTERIVASPDGSLSLDAKVNYALVLEDLIAADSTIVKIKDEVKKVPDNIYSISCRGLRLNEIQMDDLLTDLLKFGTLKYLCELDLSYNNLTYASLGVLYNSLDISKSGFCPIKRLFLTRCCIGTRGIVALWKAITGSVFIEEVTVNGNYCGDEGIVGLKQMLTFRDCKISELAIGDNSLTINCVKEIAEGIAGNLSLKGLQLQQNLISDEGMQILYDALNVHPGIERMNLSGCDFKTCNWAENLRVSVKLTELYLNNNLISDRGFRAICDTLNSCFSLRHLDLSYNLYNGRLCMALGPAIRANKGLLSLSIAGNKIEVPDVWVSIKLGLLENSTLLKLDLSYCEIKLENAKIICSAFAVNVTCDIILDFNPLPLPLTLNPRAYVWEEKRPEPPKSRRARLRSNMKVIDLDLCPVCVNLPLSLEAPGIALRESLQWRNGMLVELKNAKEVLSIVDEMGLNVDDDRDRITKINPLAAEAKRITNLRDLVDFNVDKFAFGKKQLAIYYGYESQYVGFIDINDSTTYEQVKDLIKPLVKNYFASSDPSSLNDIVANFKILDYNGAIVDGSHAKMRTVWQEALINECKLFIRPSNWISLPKAEEEED